MSNLFDGLQKNMFASVANTMGYDATWTPSAGGQPIAARVLYRGPTEKETLHQVNYDPEALWMEYQDGDFDGLKESVDQGNPEPVSIDGIGEFMVSSVQKLFDGKNFKARLAKSE